MAMENNELVPENIRFAARLSLHEYLLEQAFANAFLGNPKDWEVFSAGLVKGIATQAYATGGSPDQLNIQRVAKQLAENFGAKVRGRLKA